MTRQVLREASKVRRRGTAVTLLGPGREDLEAIGINLMDHRRRSAVLDTSLRTTAAALADATPPLSEAG
jgi:NTE family protein